MIPRHKFLFILPLIISTVLGSGCVSNLPSSSVQAPARLNEWTQIADGVEELDATAISVSSTHLVLYAFDPTKYSFQFAYATSGKSVVDWHSAHPEAMAVFNGTFFNPDYSPSGEVLHRGVALGKQQFDLDKTAFLEFVPEIRIVDTAHETFQVTSSSEAAQSYPILVKEGMATIKPGSTQYARRTFAPVRADQHVILGVVADGALTLHQLSYELAQPKFQITQALNLDGGPSTGMSIHALDHNKRINSLLPVSISILVIPLRGN